MSTDAISTEPQFSPNIPRWLKQIQEVAIQPVRTGPHHNETRSQTTQELHGHQQALLEALATYLVSMRSERSVASPGHKRASKRRGVHRPVPQSLRNTMTQEFCSQWGCKKPWLDACIELYAEIGRPPTATELRRHWAELEELVLLAEVAELEAAEAAEAADE